MGNGLTRAYHKIPHMVDMTRKSKYILRNIIKSVVVVVPCGGFHHGIHFFVCPCSGVNTVIWAFKPVIGHKSFIERKDIKAAVVIEMPLTENNIALASYVYAVVDARRPPRIFKVNGIYRCDIKHLAAQI